MGGLFSGWSSISPSPSNLSLCTSWSDCLTTLMTGFATAPVLWLAAFVILVPLVFGFLLGLFGPLIDMMTPVSARRRSLARERAAFARAADEYEHMDDVSVSESTGAAMDEYERTGSGPGMVSGNITPEYGQSLIEDRRARGF